jgi:hypothetical protein
MVHCCACCHLVMEQFQATYFQFNTLCYMCMDKIRRFLVLYVRAKHKNDC